MNREISAFRYRERFRMSAREFALEPNEEIERAFAIWSLENDRDNLEKNRAKQNEDPQDHGQ